MDFGNKKMQLVYFPCILFYANRDFHQSLSCLFLYGLLDFTFLSRAAASSMVGPFPAPGNFRNLKSRCHADTGLVKPWYLSFRIQTRYPSTTLSTSVIGLKPLLAGGIIAKDRTDTRCQFWKFANPRNILSPPVWHMITDVFILKALKTCILW